MSVDRCRSCGASIIWAQTLAGKRMPLDAEPCLEGNIEMTAGIAGVVSKARIEEGHAAGYLFYRSHFATCKDHAKWRKT